MNKPVKSTTLINVFSNFPVSNYEMNVIRGTLDSAFSLNVNVHLHNAANPNKGTATNSVCFFFRHINLYDD